MSEIKIHSDFIQGSDEWYAARRGLLTASEMRLIITPSLKVASNDKSRAHLYELLAQRISGYTEPSYVGDDMLRGHFEESLARQTYVGHFAPVEEVGFITNDEWGFTLGCSPDGLVGDDGLIEIKSRRQKFQTATIIEEIVPDEYVIQVQTELLVTRRKWCDFVSYCGGMPMIAIRVYPDTTIQDAIIEAARAFETRLSEKAEIYQGVLRVNKRLVPTERIIEQEMYV